MTAVKRTDDVLVAFKQLCDEGVDACLCMVGDGPDRVHLEQRAHELGVVRDTLFLGYQEDVAPFYAAFDALVLPSSNEGTPVSAIEALAAGRPVVATRVGGVPDVVQEGEDGFLVEPGATDELAQRLAQLARDPENSEVVPHVQEMKRLKALRRRKSTAGTPAPAPGGTPDTTPKQ